jgi:hypothetical protein
MTLRKKIAERFETLRFHVTQGRPGSGSKVIGRNTYAMERTPGGDSWRRELGRKNNAVAVRLHQTDILTYFADGRLRINFGGYNTMVTRARMNEWLPDGLRVWTHRGLPWLSVRGTNGKSKSYRLSAYAGEALTLRPGGIVSPRDAKRCAKRHELAEELRKRRARELRKQRLLEKYAWHVGMSMDAFRVWALGGDYREVVETWGATLRAWGREVFVRPYAAAAQGIVDIGHGLRRAREVETLPPADGAGVFYAWHFVNVDPFGSAGHCTAKFPTYGVTEHGKVKVELGKTYFVPMGAKQCKYGLHSSQRPYDARGFCQGAILCFVQCWGEQNHGPDKSVSQYRRVLAMANLRQRDFVDRYGDFDGSCYRLFKEQFGETVPVLKQLEVE